VPLYEYRCRKCQHVFEKIQKFSDPPVAECPKCGGKVEQLLSPPAIQFKGGGWYVTDYAKKGGASSSSSDGKSGGESTSGSADSKSEAKPKSESKTSKKPGKEK